MPRLVHTYHGFPFHEFQGPAAAALHQTERRLGRITDVALCVGTGVAVEAVRRGLVAPERVHTIGVVADGADQAARGRPWRPAGVAQVLGRRARCPAAQAMAGRGAGARRPGELGLPADATVVGAVGG